MQLQQSSAATAERSRSVVQETIPGPMQSETLAAHQTETTTARAVPARTAIAQTSAIAVSIVALFGAYTLVNGWLIKTYLAALQSVPANHQDQIFWSPARLTEIQWVLLAAQVATIGFAAGQMKHRRVRWAGILLGNLLLQAGLLTDMLMHNHSVWHANSGIKYLLTIGLIIGAQIAVAESVARRKAEPRYNRHATSQTANR